MRSISCQDNVFIPPTSESGDRCRCSDQQRDTDGHTQRQHVHHCQHPLIRSSNTAKCTPQHFRYIPIICTLRHEDSHICVYRVRQKISAYFEGL